MNNEIRQPYKEWFQRLFYAFHYDETAIEFPIDAPPPNDFLEIINKNKNPIKVISNVNVIVLYWSKEDKPEIINQAIKYINENFDIDDKIDYLDKDERDRFNKAGF